MVGKIVTQERASNRGYHATLVDPTGKLIHDEDDPSQGKYFATGLGSPYGGKQVTTSYRSGKAVAGDELAQYRLAMAEVNTHGHAGNTYSAPYDTGHEFSTSKQEMILSHESVVWTSSKGYTYRGPLVPCRPDSSWPKWWIDSLPNLAVKGNSAIQKTYPTKPTAGISLMLAELLHDGIPSLLGFQLLKENRSHFNRLGNEFLNFQFGWKPLVSDLTKILKTVVQSAKIIRQYDRDSGRNIRRRLVLPKAERTTLEPTLMSGNTYGGPLDIEYYGYYGNFDGSKTYRSAKESVTEKFSGAYTYYLEQKDDLLSKIERYEQQANHLLGTRLSPDVIWEFTPFSWLVDWFADIGSFIEVNNALSNDSLVLRYGYYQHQTVSDVTYTRTGGHSLYGMWHPGPTSVTFRTTRKVRTKATPYGFGLNTDQFTGMQWAILGALGMSKSPRLLH